MDTGRYTGPAAARGLIVIGIVLLVHAVAAGSLTLLQRANAEVVLPGTVVSGVAVGGMERAELQAAVEGRADELLDDPVRVTVTNAADELTVSTDRRSIGMSTDPGRTIDEVWSLGRRGLWRALSDQVRARTDTARELTLHRELNQGQIQRWSTATAAILSEEPRPAEVELLDASSPGGTRGARVEVTPASVGALVRGEHLRSEAEDGYAEPGTLDIRIARERIAPPTAQADLETAVATAETARSGPVTLRNPSPGADVELAPADLAAILSFDFAPEAPEGDRLPLVADPDALREHLDGDMTAIEVDPDEARVELADGELEIAGGFPGFRMDLQQATERVRTLSQRTTGREAPLPGTVLDPDATRGELRSALMASGLRVSTPILLENEEGGDDLELSPEQLTELLEVHFDPDATVSDALTVSADGDELVALLDDGTLAAIRTAPVEPQFDVSDDGVSITEGSPGTTLDADAAASRVAELATEPGSRTGTMPLVRQDPDLTLEAAEDLGIEEEVSSFTTSMVAGQTRNRNIRQAADYLDGSLILPGERLSLNDAIGRRTTARGFGEGGFIRDGEIVEVVGGGVSQMATTFMNAAWFAGVELVEFQPHSLYFSQYPVGRESTMSGNTIDVVVENDSPHGILVTTDHSDTHVTVRFWSTEWAEVDTWTGEPTNRVPGQIRDGFDVRFGRTITYPDGSTEEETYFHRYRPENAP